MGDRFCGEARKEAGSVNRRQFLRRGAGAAAGIAARRAALGAFAPGAASRLAGDPRRPQFHLLPAANWMNDPNAPIYWNGEYHMFYQYNPEGAFWGDMHWGHAAGPDMVHWRHMPIALSPTPGGPDAAGCFSGAAAAREGQVAALYTGVVNARAQEATLRDGAHSFRESQCLAVSSDPELKRWTKRPGPVIAVPPRGLQVTGFRDPTLWSMNGWRYMGVGSGIRGWGGAVLLYRSRDFQHWEYLHLLAGGAGAEGHTANPVDSGEMWECPDLFPLGGGHVLLHSAQGKVFWQAGELDQGEMRFHAARSGVLDYGTYYAARTQLDRQGNRIVWGWIGETRPEREYRAAGWAGMMSLPRALTLAADGQLQMEPAPALRMLRREGAELRPGPDWRRRLAEMVLENGCGEILCRLRRSVGFALALIGTLPAGELPAPLLRVEFTPGDPERITVNGALIPLTAPHPGPEEDVLELRLFVDGSVVELYLDRQAAYTGRFYYPGGVSPRVSLRSPGKDGAIDSAIQRLSMWRLAPISPDRLTT